MSYEHLARGELIELLDELLDRSAREQQAQQGNLDHQHALVHELRVYQVELEMQNRELREAQAETEQTRDRYTALYDFAPIAYLTLDDRLLLASVNIAGGLLLGKVHESLVGADLPSLVGPKGAAVLHELCTLSAEGGGSVSAELSLVVQRRVVEVQAVVAARIDTRSKQQEYLCALLDIGARKRVEQERDRAYAAERVLHQRFEALDRLNVAISTILATEERSSVEVVLRTVVENVLALVEAEQVTVRIPTLRPSDLPLEIVHTRPDGEPVQAPLSVAVPLRLGRHRLGEISLTYDARRGALLDTGRTLELLADRVALALEIARLNRLEQRERQRLALLEQASRSLSRSSAIEDVEQALADAAASTIPTFSACCVVYLLEKNGPRVAFARHAEPASERLLARVARRAQVIGRVRDTIAEQTRAVHVSADDALARLGARLGFRCLHLLPLTARDRTFGVVCFGAREEADPESTQALAELSARCAAALDIARLLEELRLAVDSRDTLLALVSHDLRSPLSAISLTALTLGAPPGQQERRRSSQQLDLIQRAVARMSTLVEDLLTAANIDAGHFAVEPRPTSPRELLNEAYAANLPLTVAKGLQLVDASEPTQLPAVMADRTRVLQVLTNLIGNAVKFTPSGGWLRVSATCTRDGVRFCVADTGPGIAPHQRERLFERYWAGSTGGRGLGLGLFISERIVSALGGRIWVESTPGRGASFYFTLPLAPEEADEASSSPDCAPPRVHA